MKTLVFKERDIEWQAHPSFSGVFVKPMLTGEEKMGFKNMLIKLVPGGEILPHTHEVTEVFYFISGAGDVLVNGERVEQRKGSLVAAPAGVEHGIKNNSTEDIFILANFLC